MAAVIPCAGAINMSGHIQNQLTKSLERILEDANLSGELKLSGRKLKEFPKTGKYDLSDTVIADLSKNRFGEVPDEVTAFYFLERLQLYHNAIRNVPETIGMLQSLTYLDLSRNQLSEVPREVCSLPLHVLLVAHNKLTSLPKEIGKMQLLAELDAAGNSITQLPMSIGDLRNLRALSLRSNQLGLLPLQITFLHLEVLDVSCNCISSLPLELRNMNSLVVLNIDHNPLVSPPATVCVRGRIHIFKYLENQASKDTLHRRGASVALEEHSRRHQQLRSTSSAAATCNINSTLMSGQTPLCPPAVEGLRHKARYNVDSGYSTSDGGEKRWSSDGIGADEVGGVSGRSTPSTPSTLSPSPAPSAHHNNNSSTLTSMRNVTETPPSTPILGSRISPEGPNSNNGDDKSKLVNHQQTYRQYKEAQRQQRQQDVYRPRGETSPATSTPSPGTPGSQSHSTPNTLSHSSQHSPLSNGYSHRNIGLSSPSLTSPNLSNNNFSSSPAHSTPKRYQNASANNGALSQVNGLPAYNEQYNSAVNNYLSSNQRIQGANLEEPNKRPVQKVVPSRSNSMTTKSYSPTGLPGSNSNNCIINGNGDYLNSRSTPDRSPTDGGYIKPVSPIKGSSSYMSHNNVPMNRSNSLGRTSLDSPNHMNGSDPAKLLTTSVSYVATSPTSAQPRVNWNKDLSSDKLSFTMKREFDKAREESELIQQLRSVIENRLKMTLPNDLSLVLSDGVVLCHLANNVRPRAVASVHVPSPAQPKLTMARCRRNVDNFLEACRRIGVEEGAVCQPQDILHPEDVTRSLEAIHLTVTHLLAVPTKKNNHQPHATENQASFSPEVPQNESNTETSLNGCVETYLTVEIKDDVNCNFVDDGVDSKDEIGYDSNTANHNKISERFRNNLNYFQRPSYKSRYAEDRCISNFNVPSDILECEENSITIINDNDIIVYSEEIDEKHKENDLRIFNNLEDNSSYKKPLSNVYPYNVEKNKINYVSPLVNENQLPPSALKKNATDSGSIVTKRVRFFNDKRQSLNLDIKNNLNSMQNELLETSPTPSPKRESPRVITEQDKFISNCCIAIFIATLILLYIFPLPNN